MSTIIRTRSPYFIRTHNETSISLAYFEMSMSIYKGTSGSIATCNDVYELYTMRKKPLPEEHSVTFEISEIIHNHLEQSYNGTYTTSAQLQSLWVNINIRAKQSDGTTIGSVTSYNLLAQEGFNKFKEGVNYTTEPSVMISANYVQYKLGSTLYIPLNNEAVGSLKVFYSNGTTANNNYTDSGASTQKIKYASYATSTNVPTKLEVYSGSGSTGSLLKTITLEGINECRYPVNKITFLNRWGALQELYFFKKSISTLEAKRENYNRSIFKARVVQKTDDGSGGCADNILYNQMSVNEHSRQTFNTTATEKVLLNSGLVDEEMNSSYQELLVSEYIWLTDSSGVVHPVNIEDSSFSSKTSVNDKMINYTMNFIKSADYINNIK